MEKMLLKISLVLAITVWSRTVALGDFFNFKNDDTDLHTALEKAFTWLSSLDLGYVAKRPTADFNYTTSTVDLAKVVKTIFVDLTCSYVFSAQLHMHLTEVFVASPSRLDELTEAQVNDLVFTEEAATMMAVVYDYGDREDDEITSLMHIFHMYTERMADVLVKARTRDRSGKQSHQGAMIDIHKAVEEVLSDFIAINNCQTYSVKTGRTICVRSAKKVKETLAKGPSAAREALVKNKTRFWRQTDHNAAQNLIAENPDRFGRDRLLIDRLLDNRQAIKSLKTAFGVQLDWDSVVMHLESSYNVAKTDSNMLHESIDALTTFQHEFVDLMKAIAIRLVIEHLLYVKDTWTTMPFYSRIVFLMYHCRHYNRKIADHLTELAVHLDLMDDRQLRPAIDLMRRFSGNFITVTQIDGHVDDLFKSLKNIPSAKSGDFELDGTLTVDETSNNRLIKPVDKVVEKYNLKVSSEVILYSVRKSVFSAEAFAKFVKEITKNVDFKMIKLFGMTNESMEYMRLKELETDHSDDTQKVESVLN